MKTSKRTDAHRPSEVVPAHYKYLASYDLGGVNPQFDPPFNVNVCRAIVEPMPRAATGGFGHCSICGARFRHGDVWAHVPTGEALHVGHECAEKYSLLADRSAYELARDRDLAAKAASIKRAKNDAEREAFLAKHDGLADALTADHRIVREIAERFTQYRSLSEKQIALVRKLAAEIRDRALNPQAAEVNVPAPVSDERVTFTGVVVSAKPYESAYGVSWKMTVKVTTDSGIWLAFGTIPRGLIEVVPEVGAGILGNLNGSTVAVTAKLKAGRDAHFAIMNRPNAKLVTLSAKAQITVAEHDAREAAYKAERAADKAEREAEKAAELASRSAV